MLLKTKNLQLWIQTEKTEKRDLKNSNKTIFLSFTFNDGFGW